MKNVSDFSFNFILCSAVIDDDILQILHYVHLRYLDILRKKYPTNLNKNIILFNKYSIMLKPTLFWVG